MSDTITDAPESDTSAGSTSPPTARPRPPSESGEPERHGPGRAPADRRRPRHLRIVQAAQGPARRGHHDSTHRQRRLGRREGRPAPSADAPQREARTPSRRAAPAQSDRSRRRAAELDAGHRRPSTTARRSRPTAESSAAVRDRRAASAGRSTATRASATGPGRPGPARAPSDPTRASATATRASTRRDRPGPRTRASSAARPGTRDYDDYESRGRRRRRGRSRDRSRGPRACSDPPGGGEAEPVITEDDVLIPVAGILDVLDNYAFVRTSGYLPGPGRRLRLPRPGPKYGLRKGDAVTGAVRQQREGERRNGTSSTRSSGSTPSTARTRRRRATASTSAS